MKSGWRIILDHLKSKDYWYIRYLTIFIFIGILLIIAVHILKEYNIEFAVPIFEFFNEWSLIFSASATLLLALIAFWAIIDNRWSLKLSQRERLLNEIIDWATEILVCNREYRDYVLSHSEFRHNMASLESFNVISWKGVKIGAVAKSLKIEILISAVENERTVLRQHVKLHILGIDDKLKDKGSIGRHRNKVDDGAREVIAIAVNML